MSSAQADAPHPKAMSDQSPEIVRLLDVLLEGALLLDTQGRVRHWNGGATRLFGWTAQEAAGRPLEAFIVPSQQRDGLLRDLRSPGAMPRRALAIQALHRDGASFPAEVSLAPLRGGGEPCVAVFVRDLTAARGMESALRESEARFRALAEGVPQFVWSAGPDGMVDYANRSWCVYTGQTDETVKGAGWAAALHPEDLARAGAVWKGAVTTGRDYEVEFRLRRADTGEYRWFLSRAWPRRDGDGRILQWLGTCTDIDDHKRALEALQTQALVLETLVEGVCVSDDAGAVRYANAAMDAMFGVPRGTAVGRQLSDLLENPGSAPRSWMDDVRESLRGAGVWTGELAHRRSDGTRLAIMARISPLTLSGQRLLVCVLEDVTERRKAERWQRVQLRAAEILALSDSIQQALPPLLRTLAGTLDAQAAAFWVAGPDGTLRCDALWSDPPAAGFEAGTRSRLFGRGEGLPGVVLESGRPVWVEDFTSGAAPGLEQRQTADGFVGGVAVPVHLADARLGVLEFFCRSRRPRDPQALEILSSLGSHLGQFLERKRREADLREMNATLERRVAERTEQLERRERMLLQAEALARLGSWEWNIGTGALEWSDELYRIYGLEPATFRPTFSAFLERVHPEDRSRVEASVRDVIRVRGSLNHEERIVRPDGEIRVLRSRSRVVVDADGQPVRMLGTCLDVTEQKRQEEQVRHFLEEKAKRAEDHAGEEIARFMAEASATLFASLDYETTLRNLTRLAVPRLGDYAVVHLVESDGTTRHVAIAHEDPSKAAMVEELLRRYRPRADQAHGHVRVIRTGVSERLESVGPDILRR
ncbi:MAG TPA: PAS domain S-box protein, partial [Planctomycetota bacterium]|nr:PAS domain S-box protein [Planctomycetota bacterium]